MVEQEFQEYIERYGIEWTKEAAKHGKTPCVWLSWHNEEIFQLGHELEVIKGLKLWYDDGEQEVRINEHNYKEYNVNGFYVDRTAKYDIEIIE